MNQEIFRSDKYFIMFDFKTSHRQLLLRAQKGGEVKYNTDIIFFDTTYVQLLSGMKSISIKLCDGLANMNYSPVRKYLSNSETNHLFEIESESEKYYIAASFVRVFENELEFHESILGFSGLGREMEIASSFRS
jgi:hypothetical protein